MAEVDTAYLSSQHSDIRREAVEHTNEIIKEGLKEAYNTQGAIKDSRFEVVSRIESNADRLENDISDSRDTMVDRFFAVGRDTMDLRSQVSALGYQVRDGFVTAGKDAEIQALKTQMEAAKNTTYLSDKITNDGEKTRALINDLKYNDLNRALVERQTALVNAEQDSRHWHHRWDDARWGQVQSQFGAQFAQLQSMMQNFNSQLSEARQGMVNFGTMAGVGQTSTNNNVR